MVEREGDPRREEKELLVIERELSLRVEHAMVEEKRREEQRECTMYNVVEFVMLMLLSMMLYIRKQIRFCLVLVSRSLRL